MLSRQLFILGSGAGLVSGCATRGSLLVPGPSTGGNLGPVSSIVRARSSARLLGSSKTPTPFTINALDRKGSIVFSAGRSGDQIIASFGKHTSTLSYPKEFTFDRWLKIADDRFVRVTSNGLAHVSDSNGEVLLSLKHRGNRTVSFKAPRMQTRPITIDASAFTFPEGASIRPADLTPSSRVRRPQDCFVAADGTVYHINPDGSLTQIDTCTTGSPTSAPPPDSAPTPNIFGGSSGGGTPWTVPVLPIVDPNSGSTVPGLDPNLSACLGGFFALVLAIFGFAVLDLVMLALTIMTIEIPGVSFVVALIDVGLIAVEAWALDAMSNGVVQACVAANPPPA